MVQLSLFVIITSAIHSLMLSTSTNDLKKSQNFYECYGDRKAFSAKTLSEINKKLKPKKMKIKENTTIIH